jgi:single-strand DNA-binding protein
MEDHMKDVNIVVLSGRVASDVSLKTLPSGSKVADFRLAVNERFKDKEGNQKDQATFVTVETWGRRAETCHKHLSKGRSILIEGRLKMNEWENDQGEKRSRLLITAEKVEFLDYPEKSEEK